MKIAVTCVITKQRAPTVNSLSPIMGMWIDGPEVGARSTLP
ncbi:MAG TPA: hypothetical protein VFU50_12125 [Terriglobales bacterium]|nr:hypothetical protein [Terriglobales bacterium]